MIVIKQAKRKSIAVHSMFLETKMGKTKMNKKKDHPDKNVN